MPCKDCFMLGMFASLFLYFWIEVIWVIIETKREKNKNEKS